MTLGTLAIVGLVILWLVVARRLRPRPAERVSDEWLAQYHGGRH